MYISISSKFFTNFRPKRRKRIEKQSRDPKNGMEHHGRCRMMFVVGFVFLCSNNRRQLMQSVVVPANRSLRKRTIPSLAGKAGLEPATYGLENRSSIR